MQSNDLPRGSHPPALTPQHFPTPHQAVIWRNWTLIPAGRMAAALDAPVAEVLAVGRDMGLPPPTVSPCWQTRGYVTIIRNNWHLLPYDQLLTLLDWTPEHMAFVLKEEDFLWNKLGNLKPAMPGVRIRALSPSERKATRRLRQWVEKHFPDRAAARVPPFDFVRTFGPTDTPPLPPPAQPARAAFDLRMLYPYPILYGDPLLDPETDRIPAGLFERYAHLGINAVWLQGVLYKLVAMPGAEEWSESCERRMEVLQRLTTQARAYGIGVYLYLNEPRCMPLAFFERFPEWRGELHTSGLWAGLCTSHEPVRTWLRDATQRLFRAAPGLAGVFSITMSENQTNCWSKVPHGKQPQCPRCRERQPAAVVGDVLHALAAGIHGVKPAARIIAWNWGWRRIGADAVLDHWPEGVELMCVSEEGLPLKVGGVETRVSDYTMAHPGPGPVAGDMWRRARQRGIPTLAKVQVNTTWECPAVPWIPTPGLVRKHLRGVRRAGVRGVVLSWTLGGYPSTNLLALGATFWPRAMSTHSLDIYERLLAGESGAHVRRALAGFDRAFAHFPFDLRVAYVGPQNPGPANLLYLEPTGYRATMVGFPYDSLDSWRGPYPREVFLNQLRLLSTAWLRAARVLDKAAPQVDPACRDVYAGLRRTAQAAGCHFRSMYLQTAFLIGRERLGGEHSSGDHRALLTHLRGLLREEIRWAKHLYELSSADATLGFEATNHYIYTQQDLMEKVLNVEHLLQQLRRRT